MRDGIIKGRGDSRYLKSVADFLTRYPDYESFAEALMTGTLPIDLNGINPEGWTQQGTPLNKAALLSDDAAGSMGLMGDPTISDAFLNALPKSGGAMTGVIYNVPPMDDYPAGEEDGGRADRAQVRNISATDSDLLGVGSFLETGKILLVYEVD